MDKSWDQFHQHIFHDVIAEFGTKADISFTNLLPPKARSYTQLLHHTLYFYDIKIS
jgi:hypothetical protein